MSSSLLQGCGTKTGVGECTSRSMPTSMDAGSRSDDSKMAPEGIGDSLMWIIQVMTWNSRRMSTSTVCAQRGSGLVDPLPFISAPNRSVAMPDYIGHRENQT